MILEITGFFQIKKGRKKIEKDSNKQYPNIEVVSDEQYAGAGGYYFGLRYWAQRTSE